MKSCHHKLDESLWAQAKRLLNSGYPLHLLTAVAECISRKGRANGKDQATATKAGKVAVVPYMHAISHNLRRIARKAGADVAFSAPEKLQGMCKKVNAQSSGKQVCKIKHREKFVNCCCGVVYSTLLTCGCEYIGQSGRCVNERLKEHKYNVERAVCGHLALHCQRCGCVPMFQNTRILFKARDRTTREIIEAFEIDKMKEKCVSVASIALSSKEKKYLEFSL